MKACRFALLLVGSLSFLALAMLFAGRTITLAHAELRRSDPEADAVLDRAPMEVSAWFSSQLSTGSKIGVFDGQFQAVDKGETFIDASDATRMQTELVPLSPGRYTVNWKAVAIDGHVSSGSYDFTVRESSALSPLVIVVAAGGILIAAAIVLLTRRQPKRPAR
jgi:copper resistance protein C